MPPFFVSFILRSEDEKISNIFTLSPLVSNASELIAAYNYARKKTKK